MCVLPARSSLEEAMRGELLPGSIFRDSLQHKQLPSVTPTYCYCPICWYCCPGITELIRQTVMQKVHVFEPTVYLKISQSQLQTILLWLQFITQDNYHKIRTSLHLTEHYSTKQWGFKHVSWSADVKRELINTSTWLNQLVIYHHSKLCLNTTCIDTGKDLNTADCEYIW